MKKPKQKFKDEKEMLVFIKTIQKKTKASIKRLQADNKRYDKLLKEEEKVLNDPRLKYKS